MNQFLDNIYSYNRKLFRNIPLLSIEYSKLNDKGEFYIQEENISSYADEICKKVINIVNNKRVPFYLLKLKDFDPTVYYITYKIKYRHIIVLKSDNIE